MSSVGVIRQWEKAKAALAAFNFEPVEEYMRKDLHLAAAFVKGAIGEF
jgi:hypothetical protein